jgi:hypothetical protein
MSNGFIYVVVAHFIDKIEKEKNSGPKCLCPRSILYRLFSSVSIRTKMLIRNTGYHDMLSEWILYKKLG